MLCFSLAIYVVVLPVASMWRGGIALLLMICGALASRSIPKAIKKHITWPRTGYVAYPHDTTPLRIGRVVGAVLVVGVVIVLLHLTRPEVTGSMVLSEMRQHGAINHGTLSLAQEVLLAGFGVLNVPQYVMSAVGSFRKHPWKWLLLVLMVLGPLGITLTVPGSFIERLRPVSLFVGLVWLISGGATLYSYLRQTKPPAPEAA
jgi:hypothetical protein